MKLYIASDHAGFALKQKAKKFLSAKYSIVDIGAHSVIPDDDYPDYVAKLKGKILKADKAVLFCGSAEGICIAANKLKGVRAVAVWNARDAKKSREHNDANVLCLSGWNLSFPKAKKIISVWLSTKFSNAARHKRRIKKIAKLEHA